MAFWEEPERTPEPLPQPTAVLRPMTWSATVKAMAPTRAREVARARAHQTRSERHTGRLVAVALLSTVLVVTLLLTAFGSGNPTAVQTQPARSSRLLPAGPPQPQIVATADTLRLQVPIAQSAITAVGYHQVRGAVGLTPIGRQRNEGLLSRLWHRVVGTESTGIGWYQLRGDAGPGTSALGVGALPGTDVYSPVDGTVVGITDFVIGNRPYGARIDIRPSSAPSFVVSLTQLRPDPALTVGSSVAAAGSKLGVVLELSAVERQALARYTQDAGDHVSVEVHPAATLQLP